MYVVEMHNSNLLEILVTFKILKYFNSANHFNNDFHVFFMVDNFVVLLLYCDMVNINMTLGTQSFL